VTTTSPHSETALQPPTTHRTDTMSSDDAAAAPAAVEGAAKTPADFLKSIRGKQVVVKLNSGVDYRGILACLDGYMNIAMEQTEVSAQLSLCVCCVCVDSCVRVCTAVNPILHPTNRPQPSPNPLPRPQTIAPSPSRGIEIPRVSPLPLSPTPRISKLSLTRFDVWIDCFVHACILFVFGGASRIQIPPRIVQTSTGENTRK
jgi:hypothetical protein